MTACFLGGCTKKEELLILSERAAADEAAIKGGETADAGSGGVVAAEEKTGAASLWREEVLVSESEETPAQEKHASGGLLYVHVCGAVELPGVYELSAGSRVYEAVQAAGGFTGDADQNYVNQAQILTDGVKLVIPTREEAAADADAKKGQEPDDGEAVRERDGTALQIGIVEDDGTAGQEAAEPADAKININTATQKELCNIPGVGETRAAAIISYRESHGGFTKPEDIMKVNGIKEGMYEKIKDSISVD